MILTNWIGVPDKILASQDISLNYSIIKNIYKQLKSK